jgi:diapolycopene oxygenase
MKKQVAVIGAGLGGLSAAISLAAEGFAVRVFEKNDKVGGKLNVRRMEGFTFDLGPSILTLPHIFRRLFERAGRRMEDYVQIEEVRPHWRNFFEDGLTFDLTPDRAAMEQELAKLSTDETRGFYEFLDYSKKIYDLTDKGYFARGLESLSELVRFYGPWRSLAGFDVLHSVDGGVRRFVREPHLVEALDYFIKYVGSSPYDAPALLNLIPYVQFHYGLWYVKGGMYALGEALERLARELGVEFELNCEIAEILHQGGRAEAVRLAGGGRFPADLFVSNMEVIPAYEKLLGEGLSFLRSFKKFEPSCSGLVMHLGVNRRYPQLAHHNFFYSRDPRRHFQSVFRDLDLSEDPTIYLVAPCRSDPGQAPPGCDVIKVLPHIPHIRDEAPFQEADYKALRERVLIKLERMGLTDLRRHIVAEDFWTPEDIRRKYYSNKGAIYGVVSDRSKNLGFKAPRRSRKYRNLYFVGGSVNPGGGMPMVVLSGQLARDMIVNDLAGEP